jgi:hypothetical protein
LNSTYPYLYSGSSVNFVFKYTVRNNKVNRFIPSIIDSLFLVHQFSG